MREKLHVSHWILFFLSSLSNVKFSYIFEVWENWGDGLMYCYGSFFLFIKQQQVAFLFISSLLISANLLQLRLAVLYFDLCLGGSLIPMYYILHNIIPTYQKNIYIYYIILFRFECLLFWTGERSSKRVQCAW